jgi:PTS system ascorbate-specific IIA component
MLSVDINPLLKMIYKETIALDVKANDWKDAVRAAGSLLVDTGSVEPRYVAAMIETVFSMGPYIVIAPGVALPHARPEDGVIKPCMSMITLHTPVNFGNQANDPVKLIVAFGTIDNKAHIEALTCLAKLLGDPEKLDALKQAKNVECIEDIITRSGRNSPSLLR